MLEIEKCMEKIDHHQKVRPRSEAEAQQIHLLSTATGFAPVDDADFEVWIEGAIASDKTRGAPKKSNKKKIKWLKITPGLLRF